MCMSCCEVLLYTSISNCLDSNASNLILMLFSFVLRKKTQINNFVLKLVDILGP